MFGYFRLVKNIIEKGKKGAFFSSTLFSVERHFFIMCNTSELLIDVKMFQNATSVRTYAFSFKRTCKMQF